MFAPSQGTSRLSCMKKQHSNQLSAESEDIRSGRPLILTVVNLRNGVAENVELNPKTFQLYTTSQRLNDDNVVKEYVLNVFGANVLDEDKQMGWTRMTDFPEPGDLPDLPPT